MAEHVGRIAVVGALAADKKRLSPNNVSIFGKTRTPRPEYTLGGAGGNVVEALRLLDNAFGVNTHVDLLTRVGRPITGDIGSKIAHDIVTSRLNQLEIDHIETARGECAIAFNDVVEHPEGRAVFTDEIKNPGELAHGIQDTIKSVVAGTQFLFVDPRKFRTGPIAALEAAKHDNVIMMADYGDSEWPENHELAAAYDTILRHADIIAVPTDAVVKGMKPGVKNPDELFVRLRDDFGAKNIVMSNQTDPVKVWSYESEFEIPVQPARVNPPYINAAGDTRDAGILWALSRGFAMNTAIEFGTAVASVKANYPGLAWGNHVYDDLSKHPVISQSMQSLFAQDSGSPDITFN